MDALTNKNGPNEHGINSHSSLKKKSDEIKKNGFKGVANMILTRLGGPKKDVINIDV